MTTALLEDALGISRMDVIVRKEVAVDSVQLSALLDRLHQHEPVQYVTGWAHFQGNRYRVSPATLIPRPETEELVGCVLRHVKEDSPVIWDIGTGSGCIAIALSLALPKARVFATDISEAALAIARQNNRDLGASVQFVLSDVFKGAPDLPQPRAIVSNPPYIPLSDRSGMSANVVEHEPHTALFVPNEDPLVFYDRIADWAPSGCQLFFEIHADMGEAVRQMLLARGYPSVGILPDMQGRDRIVHTEKP